MIAGHSFTDTPSGRMCLGCGKRWTDISGVRRENIEQPGWAHIGNLTEAEFNEIIREVDRIWQAVAKVAAL